MTPSLEILTRFFLWCTVLNGVLLLIWTLFLLFGRDLVFRLHSRWFSFNRDTFELAMYAFIGLFKTLWIAFNLVPLIALLIIA